MTGDIILIPLSRYRSEHLERIMMKKRVVILCMVMAVAILAVSCAHKTCPAYRGSVAENTMVVDE